MNIVDEHDQNMKAFHDIIGCAFDVFNEYRPGLTEYPYQYGLKHLLRKLGYRIEKEYPLPLYLFGEKLEEYYRCDLVLVRELGDIIIECKALKSIGEEQRAQLHNYMLLTHCPYGILINFCKTTARVYSECYSYNAMTHSVERLNPAYIGWNIKPTKKPWQNYLDDKKER